MLSKEVKLRRRIKRAARKHPAWRTCMRELKQSQLQLLKLNFNSTYGAHGTIPNAFADAQPAITTYYKQALELKRQMRQMTRQEFIDELLKANPNVVVFSMRRWAERIMTVRVSQEIEDKRLRVKFRRVYKQQAAARKATKWSLVNQTR